MRDLTPSVERTEVNRGKTCLTEGHDINGVMTGFDSLELVTRSTPSFLDFMLLTNPKSITLVTKSLTKYMPLNLMS